MTYNELSEKIRSGAYDAKLKLPTGFTRGAENDPDIKNALHDGKVERQALEARFRKDFAAMLHDEYGLSADKADIVYARAISDPASDGSDMSVLAAARSLVQFAMAVTGLSDKDFIPEPSRACPACGADVSEDADVDLENSDEDGYGGMTAPAVCPKCGTRLVAHYVSGGYAFDHFEKS